MLVNERGSDPMKKIICLCGLLLLLAGWGCGFLAEKGQENRGMANLPSQGSGPWEKYDLECVEEQDLDPGEQPNTDFQPILVQNPLPIPFPGAPIVCEPWAMLENSQTLVVYFEERSAQRSVIRRATFRLGHGEFCRPVSLVLLEDEVVFEPDQGAFEQGRVGAPSILKGVSLSGVQGLDTSYAMYYAGGNAGGIGLAVSANGRDWTRVAPDGTAQSGLAEPLVSPTAGWDQGTIGSPSILRRPSGDLFLYFDGNRDASRSIGLAVSTDGVQWTRTDTEGRTGTQAGPIITPSFEGPNDQTNWEFLRSDDPDSGSVGSPMVLLDQGPIRDIYMMYYTGNLRGNLGNPPDSVDTSIGVASSLDGIHFQKASTHVDYPYIANEVNPVLNELFPMCISYDDITCILFALEPLYDLIHGENGFCTKPENAHHPACERYDPGDGSPGSGSSNSTEALLIVDESEPSVVKMDEQFLLFYHQQSNVFSLFDGGIALATNNFTKD